MRQLARPFALALENLLEDGTGERVLRLEKLVAGTANRLVTGEPRRAVLRLDSRKRWFQGISHTKDPHSCVCSSRFACRRRASSACFALSDVVVELQDRDRPVPLVALQRPSGWPPPRGYRLPLCA